MKQLNRKVAIITGANQGLGLQIAEHYINNGASIAICARNESKLFDVKKTLEKNISSHQKIFASPCDVSNFEEVNRFIEQVYNELGSIDILVNNAGVYGPKGKIENINWSEWVKAIEINLFGSILMTRAILPFYKKKQRGKIIQLSGGGATNPLPNISAYAASKAAIVRYVETLAEEVREFNIDVNAVAPGALNTQMLDEIIQAGPEKVGSSFYKKSLKQKETGGAPLTIGADLIVFLGSDASNGITGKLISAMWDNWEEWPNHLDELNKSDVYSLRRITGRERDMDWGDR